MNGRNSQLYIDGTWVDGDAPSMTVLNKYSLEPIATVQQASQVQVAAATAAVNAAQQRSRLTAERRADILGRASHLLAEHSEQFVRTIVAEAGFALADARGEVARAQQTLKICAEEARRIHGHVVPVPSDERGDSARRAFTIRKPIGVVCAITPFNSPLNTVLHKVGPAIAAGNGVVLKPATYTPLTSGLVVQLLLDAGLPGDMIALVQGSGRDVGQWLLEDPVPSFYAFTGSTAVGMQLLKSIGVRRSQLELGSLSSTIVCEDADLSDAVPRLLTASFRKAGQICTSVQRLYVHRRVLDQFLEDFVSRVSELRVGDPSEPATNVGPLISLSEAERVHEWVRQAVDNGARLLAGGHRDGPVMEPTVLIDVDPSMRVMCEEVFGPVVNIRPFDDLNEVFDEVNDTPYGLSAGIFTNNLTAALDAAEQLRMGSVHINETSNGRLDHMPYSGVKASGMGQEGPRYAIEEMTEERLITVRTVLR